ncbi:MAG: 30S ribosomal protein S26e [Candidatus Hodarchaeales archaeon]|jgi:small subunit ribosomal protein S26e
MPKKRKSGGRTKGKKGASGKVQCSQCGKMVPSDKAKKKTSYRSYVDGTIYRELRKSGTSIPRMSTIRYYCINCAVHRGVANIRSKSSRKSN